MAEILQYVHKDGLLHRLRPETKILFIGTISVICIISGRIELLLLLVLMILLIAYAGRLGRELLRQLSLIAAMSIIVIGITILTLPSGDVIGSLVPDLIPVIGGSIPITIGALEMGTVLTLRFIVMIGAFQLFIMSTQPRDLVHTLERMHVPADYTLIFIIALRFIPTLQIEAQRIHEAQLARGYNPGAGLLGRIRSLSPLMIPLVSNSLAKTTILGLTIDLRGYRNRGRIHTRTSALRTPDYAAICFVGATGLIFLGYGIFI